MWPFHQILKQKKKLSQMTHKIICKNKYRIEKDFSEVMDREIGKKGGVVHLFGCAWKIKTSRERPCLSI